MDLFCAKTVKTNKQQNMPSFVSESCGFDDHIIISTRSSGTVNFALTVRNQWSRNSWKMNQVFLNLWLGPHCLTTVGKTFIFAAFQTMCRTLQTVLRVLTVCLLQQACILITAAMLVFSCFFVAQSQPGGVSLPGKWPSGLMKQEDKAAFRLHTYSLRGSFRLLISHQGIWAHLIPPGIYFSRQEASGKAACADAQSTFDQTWTFLSAHLAGLRYRSFQMMSRVMLI